MDSDSLFFILIFSFFIGIFISGYIGVLIAKNKKIVPSHGFWWGFFLGPIGWIIIALLNPNNANTIAKQSLQIQTRNEQFSGLKSLDNQAYIIYLLKRYSIEKNSALDKFISADKIFDNVDEALGFYLKQEIEEDKVAEEEIRKSIENVKSEYQPITLTDKKNDTWFSAPVIIGFTLIPILLAIVVVVRDTRDTKTTEMNASIDAAANSSDILPLEDIDAIIDAAANSSDVLTPEDIAANAVAPAQPADISEPSLDTSSSEIYEPNKRPIPQSEKAFISQSQWDSMSQREQDSYLEQMKKYDAYCEKYGTAGGC